MQQNAPCQSKTIQSLDQFGIDKQYLKFGVCNFESDKYITIMDQDQSGQKQITTIEPLNNFNVSRKPGKTSDAVLMHPTENIIALRAPAPDGNGTVLQIFNMAVRQKLVAQTFNENIVFWSFVNEKTLAVVTANSVYHVAVQQDGQQKKIFNRFGALQGGAVNIIGYKLEKNEKWAALFGISTPDGGKTINGHIQLYLIESGRQQMLEGHCATFGEGFIHNAEYKSQLFCYFERKADGVPKILITEFVPPPQGLTKQKKIVDFPVDPNFTGDFPVQMHVSEKFGLLYCVTKFGFLYLYDLATGTLIFKNRISDAAVFTGAPDSQQDGYYVINKQGNVILTRINPNGLLPYIMSLNHVQDRVSIAFNLASRYSLPGADNMFQESFQKFMAQGDIKGAAGIVAQSPGATLRNSNTIQMFKNMQAQPGQPQPLMIYFSTLLEKSVLTEEETLALAGPALEQGRTQIFSKYLGLKKITCSSQLGDLIKPRDIQLAIQIYKEVPDHSKAGQAMIESGDMQGGQAYLQQNGQGGNIDFASIIRQSLQAGQFDTALNMAKNFHAQNNNINVHQIAQIFQEFNRYQELTGFTVQCMTQNKPEDGPWQTQVLEYNLMSAPQVAEAILQSEQWNQYNRPKIGNLCESKQLFQLALANYSDIKDIKRCILNTHAINAEWLVAYLGRQEAETALQCCQDMLRHNRQNLQIVVNTFQQFGDNFGFEKCISIFESVGAYEGIFYFLGAKINQVDDKDVYFKYIEAATKCNQLRVLESIIKEQTDKYDPVRVKDFLKEMKLGDPKPLIFLCDIHGFVDELTNYLYTNEFNKYIEIYLFRVNPAATSQVLGTLIDLECDENYIKQILYNIRGNCPIEPLIEEFDKRNKIRVLESWLDSRVAEGNQISQVHDALAKIKIDTNQDPEGFLTNNQFYDPKVIGKFCEDRDPHLAVIAYKRTWGTCDAELIEVTNKNALFRLQARYLVERQSPEIWAQVLSQDNEFKQQVIEQVVSVALPESKSVDEVSTTVQAFMAADLPNALISLLEKIVLHNSEFGQYKKLQNLLIITAIKSDKNRVMDYINRLDNYDGEEIAKIALSEEYALYEEALVIYKKQDMNVEAIDVLISYLQDIPRAAEFAEKQNLPAVWSKLGNCYLQQSDIVPAIDAFLKAKDHGQYNSIIQQGEQQNQWEKLIEFLTMARGQVKDAVIDNSLALSYAKCEQLTELEAFITGGNSVNAQKVGDQCYEYRLYEAAKIMFISIKNNAKIASCLVRLKQFQSAIDSAKKANTPRTWKELCRACVEAGEYRLAAVSGMNLIIHPDHLEELIQHYEEFGVPNEMISLLETGMGLDRAHVGIYTELGALYAKYNPSKLMEHIKGYFQKINVSKLMRICERYGLWQEAVYLYSNYDEFDNAVNIMIEHSPIAFQHEQFCNLIVKGNSTDLYYRAITFYIEEQPMQLNDLLKHLTTKLDLSRTVSVMRKTGYLPLITDFLKSVQIQNIKEVNEALNEIFLEIEDYESLRKSVGEHESFDQVALARSCEKHELLEFRRIAAFLYRRGKQFEFSIDLSKQDEEYRDAIETAQESGKGELVEGLLKFFVENGEKEFFSVTLYTCFDLIKPDVVMEYAWRFNLMEFAMPFFIQITRELTSKVEHVQKKSDEREKQAEKEAEKQQKKHLDIVGDMFVNNTGMGMLPPSQDFNQQQQQQNQFQNQGFGGQQQGFGGGY